MSEAPRDAAPDDLGPRLARGEADAFARLYDRHGAALYRYLRARVGRHAEAEDLLQTLFLRLVRYRSSLGKVANLEAYVLAAARAEVARHHARRRPPGTTGAWGDSALVACAGAPEDREDAALARALARLAPERREVVLLHLHHDLTFAQVGEVLDISPNTASSRYRLALEDLRRLLETADAPH